MKWLSWFMLPSTAVVPETHINIPMPEGVIPPRALDPVVEAVRGNLLVRSKLGIEKYGSTLARKDLTRAEWNQHLYEELLDAACYLKRIMMEDQ
jgi:hypothetical protein